MTSPSAPSAFPKFTQDVCQLDRALLASASRAHIVIEEATTALAKATGDAVEKGLALATCTALARAMETFALCYNVAPKEAQRLPVPSPAQLNAHAKRLAKSLVGHKMTAIIKAAVEASRRAGYMEAQADLVLTLMLTDAGRKVLAGLAALADEANAKHDEGGGARNGKRGCEGAAK
jgi:hypothetical protein